MANISTTTSIWRSQGGDSTRTAYPGTMMMVASFIFDATAAAGTPVQQSITDTKPVILPYAATIARIEFAVTDATVGSTVVVGETIYPNGTATNDALLVNAAADAVGSFDVSSVKAGTQLGQNNLSGLRYITAGVGDVPAVGGLIRGHIYYFVPTSAEQLV